MITPAPLLLLPRTLKSSSTTPVAATSLARSTRESAMDMTLVVAVASAAPSALAASSSYTAQAV